MVERPLLEMAEGEDRRLVRVWNVTLVNGEKVRAATIEQGHRKESMCKGCSAPCCKGMFDPILNQEEFLSRKFKFKYVPTPPWLKRRVLRAQYLVTLAITEKGCPYHDPVTNLCLVWPDPPKSCLSYDCRSDARMKKFVKRREKERAQL